MRPADQIQIVFLQERLDNVAAENVADSSFVFSPSGDVLLRVWPQNVAKQALVWDFYWSWQVENLVEVLQLGAQSAVHTDYLIVNERADRHGVEHVGEQLPQF